jgi:hypothetical protein
MFVILILLLLLLLFGDACLLNAPLVVHDGGWPCLKQHGKRESDE